MLTLYNFCKTQSKTGLIGNSTSLTASRKEIMTTLAAINIKPVVRTLAFNEGVTLLRLITIDVIKVNTNYEEIGNYIDQYKKQEQAAQAPSRRLSLSCCFAQLPDLWRVLPAIF